jgi:hypothetical protein
MRYRNSASWRYPANETSLLGVSERTSLPLETMGGLLIASYHDTSVPGRAALAALGQPG